MPEYRLLKRHSLNKVWQEPGYVAEVPEQTGQEWIKHGIAEPVKRLAVAPRVVSKVAAAVPELGMPRAFVPQPSRFKCCGWK